MEFGILGPLLVRDEHGEHPVAAPKQRVLLAALLLRRDQVTPFDLLADYLWDGRPPRSARSALQNSVMRLRAALGPAGARLETRAGGYLLHAAPEEFDLERFTALHRRGLAALSRNADEEAADLLEAALSTWRGDALLDVPSDRLQHEQADRLADHRLQAVESRVTAELRLGRQSMVAELHALTAAHPARERFWVQLMTALHQEGRQAEALTTFQRVRRLLDEEFGVLPGPELRELHQRLLRPVATADPHRERAAQGVQAAQAASTTQGASATRGASATQGASAPRRTAPGRVPPPRQVPGRTPYGPRPDQLPAPLAEFTGRVAELAELTRVLTLPTGRLPRTVVVSGAPGSGKRVLAAEAARAVRRAFPDGVLRADLCGTRPAPASAREVLGHLLTSLGVPEQQLPADPAARAALLRRRTAGRRLLLVLEDARSAAQLRALLPSDPGCAVLVTSRRRLPELVGAVPLPLGPLPPAEAVTFLSRVLGSERAAAEPFALAELAALCEGLPLALRICARRLLARPELTAHRLAQRLAAPEHRLDELRCGELDLRAAIAGSYRGLEPALATAFARLALPGLATVGTRAAGELLGSSPVAAEHLLDRLVDAHLLTRRTPGRYRYPALLHAFARERAEALDSVGAGPAGAFFLTPRY
ncbi:AfsR/SARP family transcriptional regulator [Kitasatospora viridis]|uniref:DNA-binding SARP family transcriptional activator n=1 Tax=Kitasatospora viridis TaxID=281105 RepID=A0A561UAS0_9ACTN|nr:AfsR/SARP family transcriptional regulator [Kitasatospora viridis]TWF96453.1 DNA-binding SARP family transcriptional activator [Kitasatospora viridis]